MNIPGQPTASDASRCPFIDFEADTRLFLPRNLSYADDSYLNSFSVSSDFVYNNQKEHQFALNSCEYNVFKMMSESENIEYVKPADRDESLHQQGCELDINEMNTGRDRTFSGESSDHGSEEGIFVNCMDDIDSGTGSNGRSQTSDDHSTDSINSPNESDLGKSTEGGEATIGETVGAVMKSLYEGLDRLATKTLEASKKLDPSKKQIPRSPPPKLKLQVNDKPLNIDGAIEATNQSRFDALFAADDDEDDDGEFHVDRAQLRKCSSLKTNKTPPGTPHRKKMVRFADAMGLDLESVRHVLNADAPPKIPPSAMKDLKVGIEEDRKTIGNRYLTACFPQPGAADDFLKTVMAQKVCLENAVVTNLTVTGVVRVANIGFHKTVRIRYTTNNWVTFHDIMASYVQNSCDGPTDRFSFSLVAPADFGINSRLQFAISYTVGEATYWDNANEANYVFECFAKTTPTETEDSWDGQVEEEES